VGEVLSVPASAYWLAAILYNLPTNELIT
jgi:hypothetical protein